MSQESIMKDYYYKPWTRCPPYFLGLILGMFYVEYTY